MPNNVIKSYAERSAKSASRIEHYCDEAKLAAKKKFKKKTGAFWAYVNAITKRRSGLANESFSFKKFLQEEAWQKELATKQGDYANLPKFSKAVAEKQYELTGKNGKKVIIDNVNGAGAVPLNQSVMYHGFVVMMTPSEFLKIVHDDQGDQDKQASTIISGFEDDISIGNPFLQLNLPENEDPTIVGHEGRGRMKAIKEYLGNDPIPVHVFLQGGMRNRHITPALKKKLHGMIKSQRGEWVFGRHIFTDIIT